MTIPKISYQRHHFPADIISYAVWLYHRFCLSFREVEELLVLSQMLHQDEKVLLACLPYAARA